MIYSCRTELAHFQNIGAAEQTNAAAYGFDGTRLRAIVNVWYNGGVRDRFITGPIADFYYQYDRSGMSGGGSSGTPASGHLSVWDSVNNRALMRWANQDAVPQYYNGAAWVTVGSFALGQFLTTMQRIGMRCKLHGSAGVLQWLLNGAVVAEVTGNTLFTSSTTCDSALIYSAGASYGSRMVGVSGGILADTNPSDAQYCTRYPTADVVNTMATGTFADIDEAALNLADSTTGAVGGTHLMTLSAMPANMPAQVSAAIDYILGAKGGAAAPQNIQGAVRQAGGDYFTADKPLPYAAQGNPVVVSRTLNPATGGGFTVAELNADAFGYKLTA